MSAIFRRPRPGGGRHPPPLAPTVSNFKPRAQWTNSGSSIFLYVNLPGFYRDQIQVKMDERTRTVQVQGQRPLSTQTRARFNEAYRVPESYDMTKLTTSFSHGLLTIEFPAIVEGEKQEKAVQNQGKSVQRSNQEESRGPGPNGSSLGQKKPLDEEKQVGTSPEKAAPKLKEEERKTYKSVVEGQKAMPTGTREATPSMGGKERAKEEKVVERKEAAQMGEQKTGQKMKEDDARSRPTHSLKPKERVKDEKVVERREAAQIGEKMTGHKMKEEEAKSTPTLGGGLKPKEEKVTERKKGADLSQNKTGPKVKEKEIISKTATVGASFQKLKEEENINLGQKEQKKYTKPDVGEEARITPKKIVPTSQSEPELSTKEGDERTELDVDDDLRSKQKENNDTVGDTDTVSSEGEIQESVKDKKGEEADSDKETGDPKDNAEAVEPETAPLLVKAQEKIDMDLPPAVRGVAEAESQTYGISLLNVGVAALVIMGFGAYVFVPLVKLL